MVGKILNAKGATFVEVIVAIGLTGVVSLGVMNLTETSSKQNVFAKQNIKMDDYIRGLRDFVSDKAQCDSVLSASGNGIAANVSPFVFEMDGKLTVHETRVLLPSRGSGREVLPVSIFVYFDRGLKTEMGADNAFPVKKTTASVIFQDGAFQECSDYESEAERSAFKLACESIGGVEVINADDSQSCDFSAIDPSHEFIVNTKRKICVEVFNGAYNQGTGKCDSITMSGTNFYGNNISDTSFQLGNGLNQRINTFTQVCAGQNNFMIGVRLDGRPICRTIRRCTRGDALCP